MTSTTDDPGTDIDRMRQWIRRWGRLHLEDENVTSLGIGHKEIGGRRTGPVCIQFTVRRKLDPAELESAATRALPEVIAIDAVEVPTDVVERSFVPAYEVVPEAIDDERTRRADPLRPGVSVSHPTVSAGTAGAIVHDRRTGDPVLLSNWHVLQGPDGSIGDEVLQPAPMTTTRVIRATSSAACCAHTSVPPATARSPPWTAAIRTRRSWDWTSSPRRSAIPSSGTAWSSPAAPRE